MFQNTRTEELDETRCLSLLRTVNVGRVGISSDALPAILPVNYILAGKDILFRTVPGTKLHAAVAGSVVAFEVDQLGTAETESWSVLVRGQAEEITDPQRQAELDQLIPGSWAFDRRAEHLVRIPITLISGRMIRPQG